MEAVNMKNQIPNSKKDKPVYENIEEVQQALERDMQTQQELQNIINKLEDQFETSSARSQQLDVDIKAVRELKAF